MSPTNDDVSPSLAKLSLDPKPSKKVTTEDVADSWEDEDVSGSEPEVEKPNEEEEEKPTPKKSMPAALPARPLSPAAVSEWRASDPSSSRAADPPKRPEKTDAVARRMIVAGLGLKAPKQTDEQRAYQRSIREQEKRKREQEKADAQKRLDDAERAKAAIWED
ncbi:hypothetical protein G7046_g2423 [Stylonectria norvegica]|nr:hypothetical protein G7046_g2423 [Stylonectria norvegica]